MQIVTKNRIVRGGLLACFVIVFPIFWTTMSAAEKPRYKEGPRLNNPEPMVQAGFGMSIAVDKGRVLVGAPHAAGGKGETGQAYLFDGISGRLLRTFVSPEPVGDGLFGMSVRLVGDLVIIGSPQARTPEGTRNGAVYLFDSDTGTLVRTLYSPSPGAEIFGHAVSGNGKWLVIGDPGASIDRRFHVGAAYLFDARTGQLVHTFLSPEPQHGEADRFGHAVEFVGLSVAVSAPLGGISPVDSGVVYLFDPASGLLRHRLASPQPQIQEYFGWGLAGDELGFVIGAPGHRSGNIADGAAYVFDGQGTFQRGLFSPAPIERERFGEAVGMMPHHIIVAAPGLVSSEVEAGGVLVFDRLEGLFEFSIENTAGPAGVEDAFGFSVSGSKDVLAVGSPFGGRERAIDAGIVHLFRIPRPLKPE